MYGYMVQDGLGSTSQVDRSLPLLIDAAPQLLGEKNYALAMMLVERMQREVEHSFGSYCARSSDISDPRIRPGDADKVKVKTQPLMLKPSGALLFWLSSPVRPDQHQLADVEIALDSYAVPQ